MQFVLSHLKCDLGLFWVQDTKPLFKWGTPQRSFIMLGWLGPKPQPLSLSIQSRHSIQGRVHTELIISVLYDFFAFCDRFRNFCRHLTGRAGWEVGEKKRNWPNTDSLETWRLSHRSAITSFPALILIALSLSSSSLSSLTQSFILATLPSFIVQSQRSLPCSFPSSQVLNSASAHQLRVKMFLYPSSQIFFRPLCFSFYFSLLCSGVIHH